jgi:hypothetical protein
MNEPMATRISTGATVHASSRFVLPWTWAPSISRVRRSARYRTMNQTSVPCTIRKIAPVKSATQR